MCVVNGNGIRKFRKQIQRGVKTKQYKLCVAGRSGKGFRLGGERGATVWLFGPSFNRQMDAIAFGEAEYGITATKVSLAKETTRRKNGRQKK